jgi:hypothetical protein
VIRKRLSPHKEFVECWMSTVGSTLTKRWLYVTNYIDFALAITQIGYGNSTQLYIVFGSNGDLSVNEDLIVKAFEFSSTGAKDRFIRIRVGFCGLIRRRPGALLPSVVNIDERAIRRRGRVLTPAREHTTAIKGAKASAGSVNYD